MGKVVAGVSRFGPVVRRYCLSVVYYLWEFSYPQDVRKRKIDLTTDASRRDFLGAVKPFVAEIEAALEDPACEGIERQGLLDFTATYEGVLELMGLPFEKVKSNWDHFQLTADARLSRVLFHVFRGLDLYQRGDLELAEGHLLPGWEKLLDIEKRRLLPMPLRQLLKNNEDIVARFERDLRRYHDTGEGPGIQEFSGLPSISHLLEERQLGRMQGLSHLEARAPAATPMDAAGETSGLVIDLGQPSEGPAPAPAPEGVFPRAEPPAPREAAHATEVGANPFLDGVPGPPPARPLGADGLPMDDSWEVIATESAPPAGIETAPPVADMSDDENPWADVTSERHVSADEFLSTQAGRRDMSELFPEVAAMGSETLHPPRPEVPAPDAPPAEEPAPTEPAPTAHASLAALFDEDEDEDEAPAPGDDLARAMAPTSTGPSDLELACAPTVPEEPIDPTSTMLRQHQGKAAARAALKAAEESEVPAAPARRHSELAELFGDDD